MGFRANTYARVWSVEDKGNWVSANISVSRKDKESGRYETEFQDGYVRCFSKAAEFLKNTQIPQKGLPVKLLSVDVRNNYVDPKTNRRFVNYYVFDLEDASFGNGTPNQNNGGQTAKPKATKSNKGLSADDPFSFEVDEEIPF